MQQILVPSVGTAEKSIEPIAPVTALGAAMAAMVVSSPNSSRRTRQGA